MNSINVSDLISEYLIYKLKNGYGKMISYIEFKEFISFLKNSIPNIEIIGYVDDGEILFNNFFNKKVTNDRTYMLNWENMNNTCVYHIDLYANGNDSTLTANNLLNEYDISILSCNCSLDLSKKIRNVIKEYLLAKKTLKIDINIELGEDDIQIGKYSAAVMFNDIWEGYIDGLINNHVWPKQCTDIRKYLLEEDLASIINVPSIRDELFKFYNIVSKRVAVLVHEDSSLVLSSIPNRFLPKANYDLVISGYEELAKLAYKNGKRQLVLDLSKENKYIDEDLVDLIDEQQKRIH